MGTYVYFTNVEGDIRFGFKLDGLFQIGRAHAGESHVTNDYRISGNRSSNLSCPYFGTGEQIPQGRSHYCLSLFRRKLFDRAGRNFTDSILSQAPSARSSFQPHELNGVRPDVYTY